MRDTLQNRGRVNYSDYNQKEQQEIQELTERFLDEKVNDVGPIDSLHRVREIFNCIRLQYRHTLQNIEAMKRQIDTNPAAFKKTVEEQAKNAPAAEENKNDTTGLREKSEMTNKTGRSQANESTQKRPAIDKQTAFQEFKNEETGV